MVVSIYSISCSVKKIRNFVVRNYRPISLLNKFTKVLNLFFYIMYVTFKNMLHFS